MDLTAPGYDTTRGKRCHGSIQLEHKDDLKARAGGALPDDGDTPAMTFAVKVAAKPRPKYHACDSCLNYAISLKALSTRK